MSIRERYTFVVVGGGIAGMSCIEALLSYSDITPDQPILLLTATPCIKAAARAVHITKTLVQFDVEEKSVEELAARYSGALHVVTDAAEAVDTVERVISTASGRHVYYQFLCLCTGGSPRLIAEGHPRVIGIRDTDSVLSFGERLASARRIVIAGNGGIASELVHHVKGVEIVWVVKDQHINSVFLDPGAAEFVSQVLRSGGCDEEKAQVEIRRVRYSGESSGAALGPDWLGHYELRGAQGASDLRIEFGCCGVGVRDNPPGSGFPVSLLLDTGTAIDADLVVSATGVVPNSSAVRVTPHPLTLATDNGILVNEEMGTSVQGVFAAGDVATAGWELAPHWLQMRLWTQARQMGAHAGRAMAASLRGDTIPLDFCFEIFSHVTRFFGLRVILLGLFNAQKLESASCEFLVRVTRGREYVKLVMQDGRVQGAVLIGDTELEEMCENLILDQLDVSALGEQLLDPNIDIDDYFD